MKSIYLLEIFFSFDGIKCSYLSSRIYSSLKEVRESIECWGKKYKYAISSKKDEELIYKTEIGSYYKFRISETTVNSNIF